MSKFSDDTAFERDVLTENSDSAIIRRLTRCCRQAGAELRTGNPSHDALRLLGGLDVILFSSKMLIVFFRHLSAKEHYSAGVDHDRPENFTYTDSLEFTKQVSRELHSGTYLPDNLREVTIPKAGCPEGRQIFIGTLRDKLPDLALHSAICSFNSGFLPQNFLAYLPNISISHAVARMKFDLLHTGRVKPVLLVSDISDAFNSVPHKELFRVLKSLFRGNCIIPIIMALCKRTTDGSLSDAGVTPGSHLGGDLLNLFLHRYLHLVLKAQGNPSPFIYADDMALGFYTWPDAEDAKKTWAATLDKAGLTLHPRKTHIHDLRIEKATWLGLELQLHPVPGQPGWDLLITIPDVAYKELAEAFKAQHLTSEDEARVLLGSFIRSNAPGLEGSGKERVAERLLQIYRSYYAGELQEESITEMFINTEIYRQIQSYRDIELSLKPAQKAA